MVRSRRLTLHRALESHVHSSVIGAAVFKHFDNYGRSGAPQINIHHTSANEDTLEPRSCDTRPHANPRMFAVGTFRGVIQSFNAPFFSVLYADGDCEEVDARELQDLLLPPVAQGTSSRARRRRRRTLVHAPQVSKTRIGAEFQVMLGAIQ